MRHQLSLEVPVIYNARLLRVNDSSIYTTALPVDCSRLEITVPGYVSPVAIEVEKGFGTYLNACDLGLQKTGCADDTYNLPDGVYVIRYSVSPNDQVFVEYNHLRMTQAMNSYYTKICALGLGSCEPDQELKEVLRKYQLVRSFMDAAKAKVENCHEPNKGMELFVYAQRLLGKIMACDRVVG
jgi:hypothetical protein